MLLAHPWIKALGKPEIIAEDVEAEEAAADDALADAAGSLSLDNPSGLAGEGDYEVAEWVRTVLERKRQGLLARGEQEEGDVAAAAAVKKPALHAAPLDSVSPTASPLGRR